MKVKKCTFITTEQKYWTIDDSNIIIKQFMFSISLHRRIFKLMIKIYSHVS